MITSTECPRCNGNGETLTMTPSMRSRFVRHDDLCPSDFGEPCGFCGGSGVVDYDPNDEVEEWMGGAA